MASQWDPSQQCQGQGRRRRTRPLFCWILVTAVVFGMLNCAHGQPAAIAKERTKCLAQMSLACVLRNTSASPRAIGTQAVVTLTPIYSVARPPASRCAVRITAALPPGTLTPGAHGFHIHQYGDLRAADGSAAGGHFTHPNPNVNTTHSFPFLADRHWGDFGNIIANPDGSATYSRVDTIVKPAAVLGRAVVIHASRDLGRSEQPSGASGARVAHCVLGYANPSM